LISFFALHNLLYILYNKYYNYPFKLVVIFEKISSFILFNSFLTSFWGFFAILFKIGINSFFLHRYISDFSIKHYYKKTVIPGLCVFAVNYIVLHLLTSTIHNELISLCVSILVSVLIVTTVGGLLCFDKAQRLKIVTLVKSKLHLH